VLGTVEGLKRFLEMYESPYHGLNFCQGTVAEMLDDPAGEIFAVIRWFGERGEIFNVHFRNIKGKKLDFMEAFPDEGDLDMPRAPAAYRDVGYPYMLMPQIDGRDPSGVAFAYCYGYIQALLDALAPRPGRAGASARPGIILANPPTATSARVQIPAYCGQRESCRALRPARRSARRKGRSAFLWRPTRPGPHPLAGRPLCRTRARETEGHRSELGSASSSGS
jgi:hypothetical protein